MTTFVLRNIKAVKFLQIFTLVVCLSSFGAAQKQNLNYKYNIKSTTEAIKIDGLADEDVWKTAQFADEFHMVLPIDTLKAAIKTKVQMTYDSKNIYVFVKNYIPHQKYMVESLRRDFNFIKNDNFILVMDTYNDITNGFTFGTNAAGAEWDGQQYDGAPINLSWDNVWYSKTKQYDNYWTLEAAIPFKSIRFNKNLLSWGINFSRNDLVSTEKSSWAPVPRQFPSVSSAYTGELMWDKPLKVNKTNVSIIPYFLGQTSKNFSTSSPNLIKNDFGADAKISLTSALNLDLTYNPDFSQVEVDRQQTNLDRFELFFPERRQFFLENDDLFNNLGVDRIRPFFSRRIGLGVPISYGARVSGKLNKNLRLGAMNIGTLANEENTIAGQNFTVFSVQQKIFSRSNVTGFFINKNQNASDAFNRNFGLEYNLLSKNNLWRGKLFYLGSASESDVKGSKNAMAGQIFYNDKNWSLTTQVDHVSKEFKADVGFVPRKDFTRFNQRVTYTFLPKKSKVLSHGPGAFYAHYFDKRFDNLEYVYGIFYNLELRNKANMVLYLSQDYVKLLDEFDPTNVTGIKLKAGTEHDWKAINFSFNSQPQKLFTYSLESRYGGYFADGTRLRLAFNAAYRFQPYVQVALASELNDIRFPQSTELKNTKFFLVGPRIEITLTRNLYFTTFIQYNEQLSNTNINARLQWRYKPVSDIYLVYTDNYDIENGNVKNRAIVLKANYWWNL
jgi:hypothetical protein